MWRVEHCGSSEPQNPRPNGLKRVMKHQIIEFFRSDAGQDLIEYALLSGAIGLVGVVVWQNITTGMGTAYLGWDTGTQNLWEPLNPGAGS